MRELKWESSDISIVDLTVGGAGHLKALLEENSKPGRIVALDQDEQALEIAKKNLKDYEPIEWIHENFKYFDEVVEGEFDRIMVDLGVSSFQLDQADRGFSFKRDGPLDMRMDQSRGKPAWKWLARCSERKLAEVLKTYGDERKAHWFARKWARRQAKKEVQTTEEFIKFFGYRLDSRTPRGKHPMTRVFQAIRIAVNDEMTALKRLLQILPTKLKKGGRLSILTFHSLEDREVKWDLREKLKAVNKRVIQASAQERDENPRSRSAKLRVFEKE